MTVHVCMGVCMGVCMRVCMGVCMRPRGGGGGSVHMTSSTMCAAVPSSESSRLPMETPLRKLRTTSKAFSPPVASTCVPPPLVASCCPASELW